MYHVVIVTENFPFLDSLDSSLIWSHPSLTCFLLRSLRAMLVSTPILVSFSFCCLLLRHIPLIFALPKVCSFISWFRSFVSRKQKQPKDNGVSYCFRSGSHWCQGTLREGDIEGAVSCEGEFQDWEEEGLSGSESSGDCTLLSQNVPQSYQDLQGKLVVLPGVPLAFQGSSVPSGV